MVAKNGPAPEIGSSPGSGSVPLETTLCLPRRNPARYLRPTSCAISNDESMAICGCIGPVILSQISIYGNDLARYAELLRAKPEPVILSVEGTYPGRNLM
jgi:hypothetical protein